MRRAHIAISFSCHISISTNHNGCLHITALIVTELDLNALNVIFLNIIVQILLCFFYKQIFKQPDHKILNG